ncbi:flagella synthesis protein FlgN [Saccharospirillum alexandrii]|uniref:flagella synthesis protein FlgN n=1 Tax=Saccharospirillum alexandrii TaxID=2448477 RepID=UPI000FD9DC10|nr:flagellar export chaperone FlgN [Saccharospirillum alexandrii]
MNTETLNALQAALARALDASHAFEPLLADEHQALKTGDLTLLSAVLDRKSSLTDTLLTASEALLAWCSNQGIEPDYPAFHAWCEQQLDAAQQAPLLTQWQTLKASLDENSRSTAVNRQMLASLSARNQARLTLLKNLVGATDTYSASGTQSLNDGQRRWVDQV